MENEEKKSMDFRMNEDLKPEDVPEEFREMTGAESEEIKAGKEKPDASKITIHKDFEFKMQGGSGLAAVLNLLIKASQPPKPRAPAAPPGSGRAASSAEGQQNYKEPPKPGAVEPSSSGWLIWLIAIIIAAAYFISSKALPR